MRAFHLAFHDRFAYKARLHQNQESFDGQKGFEAA
jgi:hypothetical protein